MMRCLDGSPRLAIIHSSSHDTGFDHALDAISNLSAAAQLHRFLVARSDRDLQQPGETSSAVVANGRLDPVDLLKEIAQAGVVSRIDIVSACTKSLNPSDQEQFANAIKALVQKLKLLAPKGVTVNDHRAFVPDYGELMPRGTFFSNAATVNLVVIPEDRESDAAFAFPIQSADQATFGWHAAIELATLAGLWSPVDGSPLEQVDAVAPGINEPIVRFVRSVVRSAVSTHPSVSELIESGTALPVAHGFQAAPDPFHTVSIVADRAHPQVFKLDPQSELVQRHRINGWKLIKWVFRRIGSDLVALPRTVRQGFKSDLDETAARAAQLLVGEASWIQAIWYPNQGSGVAPVHIDADAIRAEIEAAEPAPSLVTMPAAAWDRVIEATLGVIDGAEAAADYRQDAGSQSFVVVDRAALLPPGLAGVLSADVRILTHENSEQASLSSSRFTPSTTEDNDSSTRPAPAAPARTQHSSSLLVEVTKRFNKELENANSRVESLVSRLRHLAAPAARERTGIASAVKVCFVASLLLVVLALTTLTPIGNLFTFDNLTADMRMRAFVLVSAVVALPIGLMFVPRDQKKRGTFLIAFLGGVTTLAAVLLVFTPKIRTPLTDHEVLRWFGAVGICVALVSFFLIGLFRTHLLRSTEEPGEAGESDGTEEPGEAEEPDGAEDEVVAEEPSEDFTKELDGLKKALDAARAETEQVRAEESGDVEEPGEAEEPDEVVEPEEEWRWIVRRIAVLVCAAYALSMFVIGINRTDYRPGWIEANEFRLLLTAMIVSSVVFVASAALITISRIQDETRLNAWTVEFRWLIDEIRIQSQDRQIVEGLYVHWLGTAAVLSRLIQQPYGAPQHSAGSVATQPYGAEAIRKFRSLPLELTESGHTEFMMRAGPKLSPPGWLNSQYRRISRAFLRNEMVSFGLADGGTETRPEHCAYPVRLEEAMNNTARGRRWPFAQEVFMGTLDATLRESADSDLAQALLETYLEVPQSWKTGHDGGPDQNLGDVFFEVLPIADGKPFFPSGILQETPAILDGLPSMSSFLMWPDQVDLPGTSTDPYSPSHARSVSNTVLFLAARLDVSDPVESSKLRRTKSNADGGIDPPDPNEGSRDPESRGPRL